MRGAPRNVLGVIDVEVADGVATLNGRVPGLTSKLLPASSRGGCRAVRDVFNGIEVEPPEDDCADVIVEAACAALERDPFVNASQINVDVHATSVRLTGIVSNETERLAAERDVWCIFGVDTLTSEIKVRP